MRSRVKNASLAGTCQDSEGREGKNHDDGDEDNYRSHLHLPLLDLLAIEFRCPAYHQAGNKHRYNDKDEHPV